MSWRTGFLVAVISTTGLVGCVTEPVQPLTSRKHDYQQSPDEKQLIEEARRFDADLRRKSLLIRDAEVEFYLRQVGESLVPALADSTVRFRFHAIRDPVVNAFALPNGSIYITVGMLARLENEAQLAHVLGHEIAHVVQRHGLQQRRNRRATLITAHIADLALFGTSIAYLPALGSLSYYSRESEAEADQLAIAYLSRAGYGLSGAERLFTILQTVNRKESIWGSVYSSHPDHQDRVRATSRAIDQIGYRPGRVGLVEYQAVRQRVAIEDIDLKLNVRQYKLAEEATARALAVDPGLAWAHYYRGEAMRMMAEDPVGAAREHAWINDLAQNEELIEGYRRRRPELLRSAKESFLAALAADPEYVAAHRGIGLVALAEGNRKTARSELNNYLRLSRKPADRRYVENILGGIEPQ